MASRTPSPYEAALGETLLAGLHPRLRAYFAPVPAGMLGFGEGTFDTVGSPRRWLRPLIALLADPDVLFPVWEREVPFTVVNRPTIDAGRPAVAGERIFQLSGGDRVMRALIIATPTGLVDVLGARRRFRALFAAEALDGAVILASTRIAVRVGAHHVRIPGIVAPRVALVERYSEEDDRQHVEVTVSLPLLGRVYEYAGSFRYKLKSGDL